MQERANEECCCDSSPFSGENGDGGGDGYVGRAEDMATVFWDVCNTQG